MQRANSLPAVPEFRGPTDPSHEEIAERCAEIQATWTPYEEARRRGKPQLSQIGRVRAWLAEPEPTQVFDPQ